MQVVKLGIIGAIIIAALVFAYYRQVFLPQEEETRIRQQQIKNAIDQY